MYPIPIPSVLENCAEEDPLLTPALSKPKTITKAQVQRCTSKLSPQWTDEQLAAAVAIFKESDLI